MTSERMPMPTVRPAARPLVDRVRALRARIGPGRPVLIGVAGEPGSGKSTLTASARRARCRSDGTTAVLVPMDGFHLANVALAALGRAEPQGRHRHLRRRRLHGAAHPPARRRARHRVGADLRPVDRGVGRQRDRRARRHRGGRHRGQLPARRRRAVVGRALAARRGVGGRGRPRPADGAAGRPPHRVRQAPGAGRAPGSRRSTCPTRTFVRSTFGRADLVVRGA